MDSMDYVKDYYIQGDEAFTEDHVLIYNLLVFGIPYDINTNDLKSYFNKFGEILHMNINSLQDCSSTQVGVLKFVKAKDAARVLKHTNHIVNSKPISVAPCCSWEQPHATNNNNQTTVSTTSIAAIAPTRKEQQHEGKEKEDNESGGQQQQNDNHDEQDFGLNITQLNDDVLEIVCSFLWMKDQITFARTCKRFQYIFITYSKMEYKWLNMTELHELTLSETRHFFQLCGPYITALHGYIPAKDSNQIAKLCGLHCSNVDTIHLLPINLTTLLLENIVSKMYAIKEIYVKGDIMDDKFIYFLSKFEHLKILRIKSNRKITGKYMNMLMHIEELGLKNCPKLEIHYVIGLLRDLKNLRALDMQRNNLHEESYKALVQYGCNIEVLKMSAQISMSYDDVAKLPKLKHLKIVNNYDINSGIISQLAEHKSDQLEVLTYKQRFPMKNAFVEKNVAKLHKLKILTLSVSSGDATELSEFTKLQELTELRIEGAICATVDLLKIMENCHRLRQLGITKCPQITEEFINEALKLLEALNQRQIRNYPLHLMISYSSGVENIDNWAHQLNSKKHILQLCINLPRSNRRLVVHDNVSDDDDQSEDDDDDVM